MEHTLYVAHHENIHPKKIVWKEPFAWNKDGEGTHFSSYPAFVSKTKIVGGFRYCVRRCSLRVPPLELGK